MAISGRALQMLDEGMIFRDLLESSNKYWRIVIDGTDLVVQFSNDGMATWTTKGAFSESFKTDGLHLTNTGTTSEQWQMETNADELAFNYSTDSGSTYAESFVADNTNKLLSSRYTYPDPGTNSYMWNMVGDGTNGIKWNYSTDGATNWTEKFRWTPDGNIYSGTQALTIP